MTERAETRPVEQRSTAEPGTGGGPAQSPPEGTDGQPVRTGVATGPGPGTAPILAGNSRAIAQLRAVGREVGESVSVVICTYSEARWDGLCKAVASLIHQSHRPLEVVLVIDHCPTLASRATGAFGGADGPRVVVVENGDAPGLSNARNCGWQAARGSVVAFIDDDAVAAPTWLEALLAHYHDERTAGVGGRVEPDWSDGRPTWFPPEFDWVVGCSHSGMPKATAPVRNFVGANMSFRRAVLRDSGGFSPELGRIGRNTAGCEETELCIRAAADGSALLYVPQATVHHSVPPGRATWRYFIRRCYSEGQSKATVSAITGPSAALSDERRYLLTVVPRGIVDTLTTDDRAGSAGRVLALALGVTVTSLGYVRATLARSSLERRAPLPVAWRRTAGPVRLREAPDAAGGARRHATRGRSRSPGPEQR